MSKPDWSEIDAVILDLDGTMVDAFPDVVAAVNRMRQAMGLEQMPFEQVMQHVGYGPERLIRGVLGQDDPVKIKEAVALFASAYQELRDANSTLFPGVERFLRLAPAKKAVLTNKLRSLAVAVLARFNVLDHFQLVCGVDTTGYKKPDGRALAWVMGAMGVTRQRALFIGDSNVDEETAVAAGVPFVLVKTGLSFTASREHAIATVGRLDELL